MGRASGGLAVGRSGSTRDRGTVVPGAGAGPADGGRFRGQSAEGAGRQRRVLHQARGAHKLPGVLQARLADRLGRNGGGREAVQHRASTFAPTPISILDFSKSVAARIRGVEADLAAFGSAPFFRSRSVSAHQNANTPAPAKTGAIRRTARPGSAAYSHPRRARSLYRRRQANR